LTVSWIGHLRDTVIAYFCARQFKAEGPLAACSGCHTPATLPHVSTTDATQMRSELDALLEQPAPSGDR